MGSCVSLLALKGGGGYTTITLTVFRLENFGYDTGQI